MDFVTTADGSKTLYHAQVGEHYHSKHGAHQESQHVFVKSGLQFYLENTGSTDVSVLEVGFGTGLNFLLTANYCANQQINLRYCGIEAYPLAKEIIVETGYEDYVAPGVWTGFTAVYESALQQKQAVIPQIDLEIAHSMVLDFTTEATFDVLYFDAFAAIHQPEMWSDATLSHVCQYLKVGGVFVTYAITGNLKRSMKALGFKIEKAPGAPGKREMLRAVKTEEV